ncbi:flagellar basal body-associated protein FliL [Lysinibacillus contaminans]|uniref:Flagellar protein FliL n=1 Tax=Lysinibacillus contaminans TaxID=1293441 RepID=A0ABR5K3V8_9BACI|nr:flagellar basal body-associated protein FliL [Lysinibacillus contaminans]KOS69460.1 flagellar basal body-associated protein FliL [Lysinibacillus contaminans]
MKNNKLLTILLIVLVLVLLVGIVAFVLVTQFNKPTATLEPPIDEIVEASIDVPEIMTNLADKRVVKVALKIQTSSKDAAEELGKRNFQINNIVIEELSEMTQENLEGKQGKQMFKKAVKTKLNELMQEGEIQELYITSYITN